VQELTERENEAISVIQEWSDRYAVLEKQNSELQQSLETSRDMDSKEESDASDPMPPTLAQLACALAALEEEKGVTEDLKGTLCLTAY
jgi:hypothetical protein